MYILICLVCFCVIFYRCAHFFVILMGRSFQGFRKGCIPECCDVDLRVRFDILSQAVLCKLVKEMDSCNRGAARQLVDLLLSNY